MRTGRRRLAAIAVALGLLQVAPHAAADEPTPPLAVSVSGADGHGRIQTPGLACDEGGEGAYWHYEYSAPLPAGPGHGFSNLPGDVRLNLDLHSDEIRYPGTDAQPIPADPNAFLLSDESTASLLNDRGTMRMRLRSGGDCDASTVDFDGVHASGAGTWEVDSGTGAYEGVTGAGTFTLTADVAPGADNPFALGLDGAIQVLQPELDVAVVATYWGNLGIDYLFRFLSVTYRITNTGAGYAYDAELASTDPITGGVLALGPTPQPLGDLAPGEHADVTVRYHLKLLPPPCQLIILGCVFEAEVAVDWFDALDVLRSPDQVRSAKAPLLPPPL